MASDTVPLAEFDPPMAHAVIQVLRRAGVPAQMADGAPSPDGDAVVVVPDGRREEAFDVLARSMEEVQEQLRSDVPGNGTWTPLARRRDDVEHRAAGTGEAEEEEEGRPLLFERLRQLGFLPLLLVPLMVVTLAQVRMPGAYTAMLVIGGIVVLYAWRNGRRDRT